MKNSVNGKTFDEIFDQRGERVEIDKIKSGGSYIAELVDYFTFNWLFELAVVQSWKLAVDIAVSSDDATVFKSDSQTDYIDKKEVDCIYEATPDQIALLNSYKQ